MGGPHVKTRRHSKVSDDLPADVREQVNSLLIEGATYEEISVFLKKKGFDISRSAVGRYGKDFLAICQHIKIVEDKAKTLVSGADNALVIEESVSKIFSEKILTLLLKPDADIKELSRMMADFSRLQASSVMREKMKAELKKKAEKAVSAIEGKTKKEISAETLRYIKEVIYGLAA